MDWYLYCKANNRGVLPCMVFWELISTSPVLRRCLITPETGALHILQHPHYRTVPLYNSPQQWRLTIDVL